MLAASPGHLALDRPYWPWLVLHANDFFMFTGWPLVLVAGVGIWSSVQKLARRAPPAEQDIMILASFVTLVMLDLSGTMRGESGRILLFFSPLVLLTAASVLRDDQALGRALTMTQGLLLVVMIASLRVLGTEVEPAPAAPPVDTASAPAESSFLANGAIFGEAAKLTASAGQIAALAGTGEPRAVLNLWLRWQPLKLMDAPYYLAVIPVSPSGQAAPAATLLQPFQQSYPMTCWRPGTPDLQDRIEVPLSSTEPGDWWLSLSLVDGETGQTLPVRNSNGSPDHQVGLGPFRWRSETSGAQ
ncbi:MAG: hypothetical protein MUC51_00005, partial [Anaerolineae bacterium]|nr:hypothetical protein [Anaerolineae bacterium]